MAKNTEYKVLTGIDYSNGKRAEVGDVVSDLPKDSIAWLLATGAISDRLDATETVESVQEAVVEPNETIIEAPVPAVEVSEDEELEGVAGDI
jgi:hypothetical protein